MKKLYLPYQFMYYLFDEEWWNSDIGRMTDIPHPMNSIIRNTAVCDDQ